MAPTHLLKDVDPVAICITKQGANRQRIFLRKSTSTADIERLPTGTARILKQGDEDWSVFYCVVAEPGAEEDPGQTGDGTDVWADAGEIRKAAHKLLKNKAYVNAMHDALAEEGCAIVENAVALADFEVEGPDGSVTIKKDSWYLAIEPDDGFKAKVESGDITGVSLEGTGVRVALEKDGPGSADRVSPEARKKLKPILDKYRKDPHPFAACMRDNKDRFAKPEAVCGVLKKLEGRTKVGKVAKSEEDDTDIDDLLAAGVDDDNVDTFIGWMEDQRAIAAEDAELIAKSATFGEVIAERELTDSLWRAWSALEGVIYGAFQDEEEQDPKGIIRQSLGEFEAYLLAKLDALGSDPEALAKELGTLDGTTTEEDDEMGLNEDFAELKKNTESTLGEIKKSEEATTAAVTGLVDLTGKLVDRVEKLSAKGGSEEEGDKPTTVKKTVEALGEVADTVDKLDEKLTSIAKSVEKLGEGDSSQGGGGDTPVRKSTTESPLAGLLD